MNRLLRILVLAVVPVAAGAASLWDPAPEYRVLPDGAVEVDDGGGSPGDRYLLSARDYRDFCLEFDLIARRPAGDKVRAIVVWAVDAAKHENRRAIFLPVGAQAAPRRHFRLLVLGGRCLLSEGERVIATSAQPYGEPPAAGRVGLLHYYNHNFRYENLKLTALEATSLAVPQKLQAALTRGGALRLTWEVPAAYRDVLRYRVTRTCAGRETLTAETAQPRYLDRSLRSDTTYGYRVAVLAGEGLVGRASAPVTVKTKALPAPAAPQRLLAVRRLDGSVRIRWALAPESRALGVRLAAGGEVLAPALPLTCTDYLAPAPGAPAYSLTVISPDGAGAAAQTVRVTSSAPEVRAGAGVPAKHPYLLYDAAQLARVRELLRGPEGEKLAAARRRDADSAVARPAAVPTEPTDQMSSLTAVMQRVGLAYQLLGDERYAQWVHEALVKYARLYASLPARSGRVRLSKTISGLYEAVWFVPLVCAYDLVYESPCFTAEDHAVLERDLLRPAAELFRVRDYSDPRDNRPGDLHYKCYNFEAWFISAVGLCGLMLRDADLVEHAIDGPYGLKHLLAHDVQDDGLFWERSLGYHGFVMSALFPFVEGAYHCNLDLYKLTVPDDYNEDREPVANYCVGDGDNGPKSLRLMFDGPFYCTFPDLTWPVVADSGRGPLGVNAPYRAAWQHYRDPKYAWLIGRAAGGAIPKVGEGDAGGAVRLAYDEKTLYLAAQITDQVVRNSYEKPGEVWQGDALWVGLKWREEPGGPYDLIYGLSPGDGDKVPPVAALFDRFGAPAGVVSAARYAVRRQAGGYTLEAAIPLSEFVPHEGEQGSAFVPSSGRKLTADFVLYDCDAPGGATTKEKMVCWSCRTDRYDSAQGGRIVLGAAPPDDATVVNAPPVAGLAVDGVLDDWEPLAARPARLTRDSAVMTDASSGPPDLDALLYEPPPPGSGQFALTDGRFCNNGLVRGGSSLYPSTGFALLRGDKVCANLTYGPYGGGHGHPDKLSMVVWHGGRQVIPDFGSCGYDSAEKGQWTAHTVSHNTVTVDGKSQYPAGENDSTWPCDSSAKRSRGSLGFFYSDPVLKVAQVRCDNVFEGVKLVRTVALFNGQVLDFYHVKSAQTHVYDYVLHLDAALQKGSLPLTALPDPLGQSCGYQHIHRAQGSAVTSQAIRTQWGGEGQEGMEVAVAAGSPTQLITAESITTALDKRMPLLLLRRQAKETLFATSLGWPAAITWDEEYRGNGIIAQGEDSLLALAADWNKPCEFRGGEFVGRLAAVGGGYRPEGPYVSLVQAVRFETGELKITADRPVSLHLSGNRLTMGADSEGKLTVRFAGHKPVTLTLKPGQVHEFKGWY